MKKEDEVLEMMFKSIDVEIKPPEGIKENILQRVLLQSNGVEFGYSLCYNWLLERIVKLAIPIYILLTIFTRTQAT